ncbi:MAG: hypothetical protein QOF86_2551, partial [Baekduia sp.]|nr:hypothetical protein [Baekduia sp.]
MPEPGCTRTRTTGQEASAGGAGAVSAQQPPDLGRERVGIGVLDQE